MNNDWFNVSSDGCAFSVQRLAFSVQRLKITAWLMTVKK